MKKSDKKEAITLLVITSALFGMQLGFLGMNLISHNTPSALWNIAGIAFVSFPIFKLCDYLKGV